MKKLFMLAIIMLLVCASIGKVYAEFNPTIPEEVLKVANDSIESAKAKITADPQRWGFTNVNEIERIKLGEGMRVNYINLNNLEKAAGGSLLELINPDLIETWEFTLDLDGNPKTFLTVAFENGAYRMVRFGGHNEAEAYGMARNNFERLTSDKGVTVKPTLISAGLKYYFVAKIDNKEYVLPVKTKNESDYTELKSAPDIITELKYVQENTEEGQRGSNLSSDITLKDGQNYSLIYIAIISFALITFIVILIRRRSCKN